MAIVPVAPLVYTGAQVALFFVGPNGDVEVPMTKGELKLAAEKTEVTGSTSVSGGKVWKEFGEAPSGGTFNWEAFWRVGQTITPPQVQKGNTYTVKIYNRRPGWLAQNDPGSCHVGNLYIDDNSLTFDPKVGGLAWRVTGTFNGPVQDPT